MGWRRRLLKPRIHVVTLAVDDLERSLAFYRALGLESPGIGGTEFVADEVNPGGAVAMFQLGGGLILSLYGRSDLAKDAAIPAPAAFPSGAFSLGHLVSTREEVDELLGTAVAAGATATAEPHERPWGIYSAYFRDPDGHLWEIVWNPDLDPEAT
jgi:catechol 2,3-dioxygenase-like lactoylglutathione lyase family enzyme